MNDRSLLVLIIVEIDQLLFENKIKNKSEPESKLTSGSGSGKLTHPSRTISLKGTIPNWLFSKHGNKTG